MRFGGRTDRLDIIDDDLSDPFHPTGFTTLIFLHSSNQSDGISNPDVELSIHFHHRSGRSFDTLMCGLEVRDGFGFFGLDERQADLYRQDMFPIPIINCCQYDHED